MGYRFVINSIVSLGLPLGFFSIISSLRERFILSGWLIIGTILSDIVIRITRLDEKEDEFEKEFRSLARFISFGIAPIILVYKNFDEFYLPIVVSLFLYLLSSMIRFSRFSSSSDETSHLKGLPVAISTGFLAITVVVIKRYSIDLNIGTTAILIMILSGLQLSPIKYLNFRNLRNKKIIKNKRIILLFSIIGLILLNILGEPLIWFLFLGYILVCPLLIRFNLFDKIKQKPR